jgi:hypothetical protein
MFYVVNIGKKNEGERERKIGKNKEGESFERKKKHINNINQH